MLRSFRIELPTRGPHVISMTATHQKSPSRARRPRGVHVECASRHDPDRLTAREESLARALVENPGITHKHAWAVARGIPRESATESMRVLAAKALARPRVQMRLAELRAAVHAKATDEIAYGRLDVLRDLLDVKARCMAKESIITKSGARLGERLVDAAGALRALELIGRELGMFVERKEIRHGPLDDIRDDELDQIILDAAFEAGMQICQVGAHRLQGPPAT